MKNKELRENIEAWVMLLLPINDKKLWFRFPEPKKSKNAVVKGLVDLFEKELSKARAEVLEKISVIAIVSELERRGYTDIVLKQTNK